MADQEQPEKKVTIADKIQVSRDLTAKARENTKLARQKMAENRSARSDAVKKVLKPAPTEVKLVS